jgi:hypothetical protein
MAHLRPCTLSLALAALLSGGPTVAQSVDLVPLGTYASGIVGGSEIVTHDPSTQRLFITNGGANRIDIVNVADPAAPALLSSIDLAPFGGNVNSVAVKDGLLAAAVASNNPTTPGNVVVFGTDGAVRRIFAAGVLPDHVSFSPDGNFILAANEGEPDPIDFGAPSFVDPPGSITIIDLRPGLDKAVVTQVGFTGFDGRENELRARGVRLFPNRSAGRDLEPEYIAVSPDNTRAFVTLQEANAFAVLDLAANPPVLLDIVPAHLKDHRRGLPSVEVFDFPPAAERPVLGTVTSCTPQQTIRLGGFSGLWFEGVDGPTGNLRFATVPDRGPNGEPSNADADPALERPFVLPDYQPRVVRFALDPTSGEITLGNTVLLTRQGGAPLTGLPNLPGNDEEPVDLNGQVLAYDPLGGDLEGLVVAPNGDLWMVDEYRPAIYRFSSTGELQARYVPEGTNPPPPGAQRGGPVSGPFGTETLPAEYSTRRPNRGFEGMALDTDAGILYAFIQTPLANPDTATSNASKVIRMIGIDPATGSVVAEYVYLMDKAPLREAGQNPDKVGDAAYAGNGTFYIVERDDSVQRTGRKLLFQFSLAGATNLRAPGAPALLPGQTLEQHSPDELAQAGIRPVSKIRVANLPSLGYFEGDKLEGLAWMGNGDFAVINDNDFGMDAAQVLFDGCARLEATETPIQLGLLRFDIPAGLDASDRDGPANGPAINIANWPIYGMHMPDSIAAFGAGGRTFYASAGEGDDRGEVARVSTFALDPTVFPAAGTLQLGNAIGRLNASRIDGNLDADPQFERLQVLGSRSFAIWDQFGHLVYDSGDLLEQITADRYPTNFNADNEANDFDSRSDNKGPEPEAIAVGTLPDGRTYAFVGLERIGGVAVFDVTDPYDVQYRGYVNNRDFSVPVDIDVDPDAAGDLGPEGVLFIPAADSPTGAPLLVVANEISGTTTIYGLADVLFANGFEPTN